ncbi:S-adenosyl-L-methionine-dependent methyltransferase [Xylaria palmicola]|nr:S-adenosyl-L-methionine-dependent methyltransferase [Xylaria palmicola]
MARMITSAEEYGFSARGGVDWSMYAACRPIYPPSFFQRIYAYHAAKPQAAWSRAHDVGAGAGIVSAGLAGKFDRVVMSDPNDGHAALGHKILVDELGIPAAKLAFLQEGAEKSSVASGSVDLVTACEMIHWTNTDAAVDEFYRQLKTGGTVVIAYYSRPRIVGNAIAQRAWRGIFRASAEKIGALGALYDRLLRIVNSGLENVELPGTKWRGVKRVYINTGGSVEPFALDDRTAESKVKEGEEKIWEEADEDWMDIKGIDWFKPYFATWTPRIPDEEIRDLWDQLEAALNGQDVRVETPVVLIFGTKV